MMTVVMTTRVLPTTAKVIINRIVQDRTTDPEKVANSSTRTIFEILKAGAMILRRVSLSAKMRAVTMMKMTGKTRTTQTEEINNLIKTTRIGKEHPIKAAKVETLRVQINTKTRRSVKVRTSMILDATFKQQTTDMAFKGQMPM